MICGLFLASCPAGVEEGDMEESYGRYFWPEVDADGSHSFFCQYGSSEMRFVTPMVRRDCDEFGNWVSTNFTECASFSVSMLRNISMVSSTG